MFYCVFENVAARDKTITPIASRKDAFIDESKPSQLGVDVTNCKTFAIKIYEHIHIRICKYMQI